MKSSNEIIIYVVEDNFAYSYVLEQTLREQANFKITTISTGEECIALMDKNTPDLVLLDYNLDAGLTGLDVLRAIRSKKPQVPIIVLSSQPDVQVAADLLKEGAFDYIQKKNNEKAMKMLYSSIQRALKM